MGQFRAAPTFGARGRFHRGLKTPDVMAVSVRTRDRVSYLTGFAEYPFCGSGSWRLLEQLECGDDSLDVREVLISRPEFNVQAQT